MTPANRFNFPASGRKRVAHALAVCLAAGVLAGSAALGQEAGADAPANVTSGNASAPPPGAMQTGLPMPEVTLPPQQPPAATMSEPAALPPDSPERHAQEALRQYLTQAEPKRLDMLTMLKFDRTQITERMNVLVKTGAADELIDAYLYYLTAYTPDPKNYVDAMARLALLLNERNADTGVLTLLFQEGERFPPTSPAVVQMRLTEAEYLTRVGLPQAALVQLHALSDVPGQTPQVRVVAIGRAGFLHERLGQPEQALEAYLKTADDLAVVPQASEAVLRASLLQLELGREDDALATLAKLQAVPPELLRQTSAGPAVTEMLALAKDPAAAKAYWNHQKQWFPLWQKLEPSLGINPDDQVQLLGPSTEDYQRLGMEGNTAMNNKDSGRYYRVVNLLMRSARWRPSDLTDAANLLFQGLRLTPDHAQEFLALCAAMAAGLPPGQEAQAKQLTQLLVGSLIDNGHADQARDLAAQALAQYGVSGGLGQGLARLYGFAVLRAVPGNNGQIKVLKGSQAPQGGDDAIRYLRESLKDPEAHGRQRALAIAVLCDLYLTENRDAEAQALLQQELAAPARESVGGASYQAALRDSLQRLQQRQVQATGMDAGLNAWWNSYQLPWYGYMKTAAQTASLSLSEEPAAQAVRQFAKALDPANALATRATALMDGWSSYPMLPLTGSAVAGATLDFAARTDLPEQLRYVAWAKAVWHLLWTGQRAAAQKLLAAAPDNPQVIEDRPSLNLWMDYLDLPPEAGAQQAFAEKLLTRPKLNRFELVLVVRVIETLARVGAADAAEAVNKKLQMATLDDSAADQYRDLRDNMEPLIAQYRATQPAYESLRTLVLQNNPTATTAAQVPERWRDLNDPEQPDLDLLTQEEAGAGLLAVIRDRLPYGRHPLQVFLDYGEALPVDAANNALRFRLFEMAQKQAQRDEDRFYAAMFTGLVDFDDTELARRGWEILNEDKTPAAHTRTADFLRYYSALMDWRMGKTVNLPERFGPLNAPGLDAYKLRLALEFYLQQGDMAALQQLLQGRPEQDFLQTEVLAPYLRALRVLGQEAALAHASAVAQGELSKAVVASWARPEREQTTPVFELAEGLKDPAAYPRAWVDYVLGQMRNENARDLVRIDDARLQGNWPGLLAATESFLARNPTQYDYYWTKAQALIQMGRLQDATGSLRVYVKYSHNDTNYPEAVQWLKKIEALPPTAPTSAPHAKF